MTRVALVLAVLGAQAASAHVELDAPLVRYPNTPNEVNKSCPCGAGNGNDHCTNATITDLGGRNPDRVTTFTAGETVDFVWRETIGHAGRWRIAFAEDGADMDVFDANILLDITDPAGGQGNVQNGNVWQVSVTMPNTPCDNCVLQLIQDMGGATDSPSTNPRDPNGDGLTQDSHDLYFQCADIVLLAEGEGEGEGEGDEGEGEGDDDGCASSRAPALFVLAGVLAIRRRARAA